MPLLRAKEPAEIEAMAATAPAIHAAHPFRRRCVDHLHCGWMQLLAVPRPSLRLWKTRGSAWCCTSHTSPWWNCATTTPTSRRMAMV